MIFTTTVLTIRARGIVSIEHESCGTLTLPLNPSLTIRHSEAEGITLTHTAGIVTRTAHGYKREGKRNKCYNSNIYKPNTL